MNSFHTQFKTITVKPELRRCFSIITAKNAMRKNNCEEVDCCGNPINVQPKPTIHVERTCHPCSFFTWKPKIPILKTAPPLKDVKKKAFKKKHCYAGMKFREKSLAQIKKEAEDCQKRSAVIPFCPSPPPPVKEKPVCDLLIIPAPDWDINAQEKKEKEPC